MADLNKDEYVFLMTIHTQNEYGHNLDYTVIPFKSMADIKHAVLNVITNNIKNYKNDIIHISYNTFGTINSDNFGYARIEYKTGMSKIYNSVRRKIQEVK